ncbi:alpha/beta hydrolase [Actinomadura sp. ATCC 31491]|uniref:Alpha/beta hydrolase n=1 Tax=Actinomadura luzonensis TaxID=2805427 RepID=A0ABT0FYS5_9ACTN|nr:alpha/beta fold hydrolase [Actinomadura luzonensis]MCK2217465.1 alpha/beta hydrolase [Actinomadura luzonensis]
MLRELDLRLDDGRTLHVYDTGPAEGGDAGLTVLWHHGTPNIGLPPAPLFPHSDRLGVRWISYDRPGYGASTPLPGRDLASAAAHAVQVADALGVGRFAVMGHSGGGAYALACAALLPERVVAAVSVSGPAPYDAPGLDWFAGMCPSGQASLRAAREGRAAKERHEAESGYDPEMFTPADHAALGGDWSWFGEVVGPAVAGGPGGAIDDDLSYVAPWGCDPSRVAVPVLLLHGAEDRVIPAAHGGWLSRACPDAELRLLPEDGHISVLRAAPAALEWLARGAGVSRRTPGAAPA